MRRFLLQNVSKIFATSSVYLVQVGCLTITIMLLHPGDDRPNDGNAFVTRRKVVDMRG